MTDQVTPSRKIFISYRRADNPDFAGRIYDAFRYQYGASNVFMDVYGIRGGANFDDAIAAEVQRCDALVAIIGPKWLQIFQKKLHTYNEQDSKDYVVHEISTALKAGKFVIPIGIKGAKPPPLTLIPPEIRDLFSGQMPEIDATRFHTGMEKLIEDIEAELNTRQRQRQAIRDLNQISPAPGLALSYYAGGLQAVLNKLKDPNSGIEILDGDSPIRLDGSSHAPVSLNVVIPIRLAWVDKLNIALKNELPTASIPMPGRNRTFQAIQTESGYHLIDVPTTMNSIDWWIKRRIGAGVDRESLRWRQIERGEIEGFEFMLQSLVNLENSDPQAGTLIQIMRYDPDNLIPELRWLHDLPSVYDSILNPSQ